MRENIRKTKRTLTQTRQYSREEVANVRRNAWDGLLIVRMKYSKEELQKLAENDEYELILELPVWI